MHKHHPIALALGAVVLLALAVLTMVAPAEGAGVNRQGYVKARVAVVEKFGADAAGRDIRRGLRTVTNGRVKVTPATWRDFRRVKRTLRALLRPAPRFTRVVAGPPPRPPAGVRTPQLRHAPPGGLLSKIRQCESGGNYRTETGNGFSGAYQFVQGTWDSVAPAGYRGVRPSAAPPHVQDAAAARLLATGGPGHWPVCAR
jgi:hypothetical protein